jgi:hypothetical protein
MNRRSFFKFLGIGTVTAAVAPCALANQVKRPISWGSAFSKLDIQNPQIEMEKYFEEHLELTRQKILTQLRLSDLNELQRLKKNA